jgi:hypothetical protein
MAVSSIFSKRRIVDLIARLSVGQHYVKTGTRLHLGRDSSLGVSVLCVELAVVRQDKLHVIMEVGLDWILEVDDGLRLARYPGGGR